MAWIESHQNLSDHPKTRKLARILDISKPTTIGHLHCLWWWALDYADDGDLSNHDTLDIAIGAEWEGDPDEFVDALVKVGFLDEDDGLVIHDWEDYAGKLIQRRRANARRMQEARAKNSAPENDSNEDRAPHVQRTQRARVERPDQPTNQPDQQDLLDGAVAPPPKPKLQRATRLPDDFTVTDDMHQWAVSEGATDRLIAFETDKFLDYWPTVPGQKGVKLDWIKTWKNWMRRAIQEAPTGSLRLVGQQQSPFAGRGYDPLRSMTPEENAIYQKQLAEAMERDRRLEEEQRKRGIA